MLVILRHIVGPLPGRCAADHSSDHRATRTCLTFGHEAGVDIVIDTAASWIDLVAACPIGREPEALALWLPYEVIPQALWDAPVPILGFVPDWNVLWEAYRVVSDRWDVLFTDGPGGKVFRRGGCPPSENSCHRKP